MSQLIIKGGRHLRGEVEVSGMKNAATPILAATILSKKECILENMPRISDVQNMIEILKGLGAQVEWLDDHSLSVCCDKITPTRLNQDLVKKLRSSVLFIGPLLARFGKVLFSEPGGCLLGNRPLNTHFYALQKLGAEIQETKNSYALSAKKLKGAVIILPEFSVTATENLMMAACLAEGETTIKIAAAEPHVEDLGNFLKKMGVRINGLGTHTIRIQGIKQVSREVKHDIIPDQIEAGTFAVLAAATKSQILIKNVNLEHLDSIISKLQQIGVKMEKHGRNLLVRPAHKLKAFKFQALPYPGLPTDLQAPFGVLATQCYGTSLIHDPLFEGRLGYIQELIKMGANAIVADSHRAIINAPTPLYGTEIKTLDLRAGATLIIAGLLAKGETVINQAEIIDRGYEKIEERLRKIGAQISRIS